MTVTQDELKPCPFCGGDGLPHRVPTGWRVSCINCDCQPRPGFPSDTEAEAIIAWNTRASEDAERPLPKLIEALEAALKECAEVLAEIPTPHSHGLWTRMCNAMRRAEALGETQ